MDCHRAETVPRSMCSCMKASWMGRGGTTCGVQVDGVYEVGQKSMFHGAEKMKAANYLVMSHSC